MEMQKSSLQAAGRPVGRLSLLVLAVVALLAVAMGQWLSGGQGSAGGDNTGASAPVLPYKLVDWPTQPTSTAGFPAGPWKFIMVTGLATTPRGNILLLHRGAHPFMEFEPGGKFVRSWGNGMISEGDAVGIPEANRVEGESPYSSAFYGPGGCTACGAHEITVDPEGNIWAVDTAGHVVYKMNPDGKEVMRLGTQGVSGTGPNNFHMPTDVAVAANGDVYVSDGYGNARIVKYSRDGKYLLQWGTRGTGPGEFGLPHNVMVDAQGRVYVSDRDNQRIQVFDSNGKFLNQWPVGAMISTFAITKDQKIWTGTVLRDLQGKVLGRLPDVAKAGHGSIAITDSGDLYFPSGQKFVKQ